MCQVDTIMRWNEGMTNTFYGGFWVQNLHLVCKIKRKCCFKCVPIRLHSASLGFWLAFPSFSTPLFHASGHNIRPSRREL